jgi:hypothetical protein
MAGQARFLRVQADRRLAALGHVVTRHAVVWCSQRFACLWRRKLMAKHALTSGTRRFVMEQLIFVTTLTHTLMRHVQLAFCHAVAVTALVLS